MQERGPDSTSSTALDQFGQLYLSSPPVRTFPYLPQHQQQINNTNSFGAPLFATSYSTQSSEQISTSEQYPSQQFGSPQFPSASASFEQNPATSSLSNQGATAPLPIGKRSSQGSSEGYNQDVFSYEYRSPFGSPHSHYTPSYAGSYTGSRTSSGSFREELSPPPGPALAFPSSDPYLASQQPQQSYYNSAGLYSDFRGMSFDKTPLVKPEDETGSPFSAAGVEDMESRHDGVMRGWSAIMDDVPMREASVSEQRLSPAPLAFAGATRQRDDWNKDKTLQGRKRGNSAGPMLGGSAIPTFSSHLSDSPPPSTSLELGPLPNEKTLFPLAIPSQQPTLNLIQPTPSTARPRKKGKGTLELERALDALVDRDDERELQFPSEYSSIPTSNSRASPHPQPAYVPQSTAIPESSNFPFHLRTQLLPSAYYSTLAFPSPPPPLPFGFYAYPSQLLQPPLGRRIPTRQRSKSEADMVSYEPPTASLTASHLLTDQYGQTWSPSVNLPSLFPGGSQAPSIAGSAASGSGRSSPNPEFDISTDKQSGPDETKEDEEADKAQHKSRLRKRPNQTGRKAGAGGPGYSAMLATSPGAGGHTASLVRRARSNGAQSKKGADDTDSAYWSPPPPSAGFAPPPPAGSGFAPPPPASANFFAQLPGGQSPRPYVYHSPGASPSSHPEGSQADREEEGDELEDPVTIESKTTAATIEAAQRRRAPGTKARFICDLCGETFTRRYNLRGHQRAHRNEKPYSCSYEGCEKSFARAHDCKRHELLHLGVRRYHCEPCSRDFVRLDALQRHHRSEVGQVCVQQLRESGFIFGYDCTVTTPGAVL